MSADWEEVTEKLYAAGVWRSARERLRLAQMLVESATLDLRAISDWDDAILDASLPSVVQDLTAAGAELDKDIARWERRAFWPNRVDFDRSDP